ncbi:MAG: hypothetical protein GC192_20730 [Bacteroidetes bacterium]|nr:hypothetical protein [Bacteroidota bacterium]
MLLRCVKYINPLAQVYNLRQSHVLFMKSKLQVQASVERSGTGSFIACYLKSRIAELLLELYFFKR